MAQKTKKKKVKGDEQLFKQRERSLVKELEMDLKKEENNLKKIKLYLARHLDNYTSKAGRRIEGTLFFLNFFVLFLFVLDTTGPTGIYKTSIIVLETVIVGVFVLEYIARMWIARSKFKHFINGYSIIDLLSILPILVNFINLTFLRIFRIMRLFRILRVLRFQRVFKAKDTMFGRLSETQLIVIRIVLTVFTLVFVSSGLIWTVESRINPEYGNIFNAMYFSIVTLSTVGYGDITPLSPLGKSITVLMILSGIALVPWQLAKLVKVLFESATKVKIECRKCGLTHHDTDAVHCKKCGTVLKKRKGLED